MNSAEVNGPHKPPLRIDQSPVSGDMGRSQTESLSTLSPPVAPAVWQQSYEPNTSRQPMPVALDTILIRYWVRIPLETHGCLSAFFLDSRVMVETLLWPGQPNKKGPPRILMPSQTESVRLAFRIHDLSPCGARVPNIKSVVCHITLSFAVH
jgi:hypothetical protein